MVINVYIYFIELKFRSFVQYNKTKPTVIIVFTTFTVLFKKQYKYVIGVNNNIFLIIVRILYNV